MDRLSYTPVAINFGWLWLYAQKQLRATRAPQPPIYMYAPLHQSLDPPLLARVSLIAGMEYGTGRWNGKEWNSEHTKLQLTRAAQSRLNYLVYL